VEVYEWLGEGVWVLEGVGVIVGGVAVELLVEFQCHLARVPALTSWTITTRSGMEIHREAG